MTQRQSMLVLFALLAAATAVVFLAISIDHELYAPGAKTVTNDLARSGHLRELHDHLPPAARHALTPTKFLRKGYSIVAFAIVGFFAAPLIPRPNRLLGTAIVVASFSLVIEIVQRMTGAEESLFSNAFDIACGAAGGAIGALIWNAVRYRRPRGDAAH